jgi:acyl-CoA reductase-like NAD-dependent aldehyde dehydrogenase
MLLGGEIVEAPASFGVLNPATEGVFAQAPECSSDMLDAAVGAARAALPAWRSDEPGRRRALRASAQVLRQHTDELAELFTREQGRALVYAKGEIEHSASWLEQVAELALPGGERVADNDGHWELRRVPRGVVAAITPWNFPILTAVTKLGPALLMGNTAVLKPSEYTPLTTLAIGRLLADVLPPGVLNIVCGLGELGARLTSHPGIDMVSFTGSIPTGVAVARAVAPSLRRFSLELGGNDAAVVLPDADVGRVVGRLADSVFGNNGQTCIAVKRAYVHEAVYEDVVAGLVERAERMRLGDGLDPDVDMGPLNNRPLLDRVVHLTDDAVNHGARVHTGGRRLDRPGYFFPPTIVTGIEDGVRLVDEEQFGPVLPIMPFRDVDDAVARANRGPFGLGGSVWTADLDRAQQIADTLECGSVWINDCQRIHPEVPFRGAKMSGHGVENGAAGLEELSTVKAVFVRG